jgi:hypothetical protein
MTIAQPHLLWITLWISEVIHALTVAPKQVIHALTVALLRINGRAPINTCSFPLLLIPVIRDPVSVDNPNGFPTSATVTHHQ